MQSVLYGNIISFCMVILFACGRTTCPWEIHISRSGFGLTLQISLPAGCGYVRLCFQFQSGISSDLISASSLSIVIGTWTQVLITVQISPCECEWE